MKIGLGAVQFGLDYGISNTTGKTPENEVNEIISYANDIGVNVIDTASFYGNSEEVLGKVTVNNDFSIVTKTPGFNKKVIEITDAVYLEDVYKKSLDKLGKKSLYGLLIHNVEDLFLPGGHLLFDKMLEIKDKGLVKKIGASVYSANQVDKLLSEYTIDLIQLPINILDQRLLKSGYLSLLKKKNIEIHARSVFLQGLLLMEPENIPPHFDPIKKLLKEYHKFIKTKQLTAIEAAMSFVSSLEEIDVVLCGINTKKQLLEVCENYTETLDKKDFERFAVNNVEMLNPSKWNI